jgi:ankyrin repeat protein
MEIPQSVLAHPDFNLEYDCSPHYKAKHFNAPMKWVMMTKQYPALLPHIRNYYLSHPEEINRRNSLGRTAIFLAVRNSNTCSSEETVKLLLEFHPQLNISDNEERTPLLLTITNIGIDSTLNTMVMLLNAGADVNYGHYRNCDPLCSAILTMSADNTMDINILKEIIARKPNFNTHSTINFLVITGILLGLDKLREEIYTMLTTYFNLSKFNTQIQAYAANMSNAAVPAEETGESALEKDIKLIFAP